MATKTKVEVETTAAASSAPASAKSQKAPEDRIGAWWSGLAEHQRAGYGGLFVTLSAGVGAASLFTRTHPTAALAPIGVALYNLCGWSAYPLVFILLGAGVLRIAEGFARRPLTRRWLPVQLVAFLLVLVAASRIVYGGNIGGMLGFMLALLFAPLPRSIAIGLLLLVAVALIVAVFGVTLAGMVALMRRLTVGAYRDLGGGRERSRGHVHVRERQRERQKLPVFDPGAHRRTVERAPEHRADGPASAHSADEEDD